MKKIISLLVSIIFINLTHTYATTTKVNTLSALSAAFTAALPGDSIIVLNGTYNWGPVSLSNTKNTSTGAWIVLKAETLSGVIFTGNTYLQFSGTKIMVDGFKFSGGNSGTNAVLAFRSSSSALASYSRITNITIDNYNSVDTLENEWIAFYGTNNRLDHCTFINKSNPRATVVVWYSTATFPAQSVSTFHKIDSNYFYGRSFMGSNGGETIRVGVGNNSRTFGFNTIEYNLFENCTQTEPEIVSNKSAYNTYRYNTFKNCNGGLTLRMGKSCNVYGNYFINNDATKTDSYGIRIIDKGHKVFNNYCEGLLGTATNSGSMRSPIVIYNGSFSTADSLNPLILNGAYLPADSCVVAFNTIVNCSGGYGLKLGYTDGGLNTYTPKGVLLANNIIKMSSGQAIYNDPANTTLTYVAEGNLYNTPSGLGITNSTGFSNRTLSFGARSEGILTAPANVKDSAVNTLNYSVLLGGLDAQGQTRSAIFDVGCDEINGTGAITKRPLDSTQVGVGKAAIIPLVQTITFPAIPVKTVGIADFSGGATASSGLAVTYTSSNTAVATIVNNLIHIVGAGTAVITASQAGSTYYYPAAPVAQTLTVIKSVVYVPSSTIILSGSLNSGNYGNLATNNSSYYVVNSTTTSTRKLDWYGSVKITQPGSSVSKLTINYDGKNSASKTQVLYLYNWITSAWAQIDSRTVSTTDITVTYTTTSPAVYISSLGEIRLRVYSTGGTSNYTCSGDWMQFTVETSSSLKSSFINLSNQIATEKISVSPNPVNDFVNVEFDQENSSPVSLIIYNTQGIKVKSVCLNKNITLSKHIETINVSALPNGLFFIRIQNKRNVIKTQSIQIQH